MASHAIINLAMVTNGCLMVLNHYMTSHVQTSQNMATPSLIIKVYCSCLSAFAGLLITSSFDHLFANTPT